MKDYKFDSDYVHRSLIDLRESLSILTEDLRERDDGLTDRYDRMVHSGVVSEFADRLWDRLLDRFVEELISDGD